MNLDPFILATSRFPKLLKPQCFNGCKGGKTQLFIWDRREFGQDPTTKDAKACVTICKKCLEAKLLKDPPTVPQVRVQNSLDPEVFKRLQPGEWIEPETTVVSPDDLFKPKGKQADKAPGRWKGGTGA